MKKKWLKRGSAILLSMIMALSLFPGMNGTIPTVQAAEGTAPSSEYWTDAAGLKDFEISEGKTIGKIKFGLNGSDARLWAICGEDGSNLALLSTSAFAVAAYGSTNEYSKSNFVTGMDKYLTSDYFSKEEKEKMADVTVKTNEPNGNGGNEEKTVPDKKLYLPNSQDQNSYGKKTIYVGSSDDIAIDVTKLDDVVGVRNIFWLRSPYYDTSDRAFVVNPGGGVMGAYLSYNGKVVPAFNLNLSDVSFASAADAATSTGYKANSEMTANTYTLRYESSGKETAVVNAAGSQVAITDATDNMYLVVQNSAGAYTKELTSSTTSVSASDIEGLDNFNNCKVWLESTDTDRITTVKMATQAAPTQINSVALTDIAAPVAGSAFDTEAACATTGISNTAPEVTWTADGQTVTGNADYNTAYTASVTLEPAENYEFADIVTTVNGQNATSVTKNADGTLTVTYTFPETAKAKLTGIITPTGITVANGTAYADMGLPTNVAIITEGNTETTAEVAWDTTTPASGSYDSSVLTEQSVTLNGTVTCPSNIDRNGVALTTTITVKISAAGIVGAPTFAPAAGTYTENQSVALSSSTDGATIHYTTDGTTPTTDSNVYTAAIPVTGTAGERISTTIKAIAVKSGMQNSSVTSATYVIELPAPTPSTYAVTVNNGTGDGNYAAGATVTITADAAPSGQEFDKWTVVSGGVTLASATSATTTFEMPASAVEVTATYKNKASEPNPPAPSTYAVTVKNGTGDGNYAAGATVTITADAAPSGQEFDKWTVVSGGVTLASATSATTTFEMPASAVEVTATYKNKASEPNPPAPSTYAVMVNNGTGDGNYAAGATVTITADTAPSGQEFDKWTVVSGGVTLASATSATTTFEMPASAVEVTAIYKNKASDSNSPAPTPTYTITAGAGGTSELGTSGTITITCDGALDKLTGIYVDDKLVDAANYTLQSGSTILTFNASYLNTLSVGTHKVKFQYSDGSAETTFVIKEASAGDTTTQDTTTQDTTTQDTTMQNTTAPSKKDDVPKTGDNTPIAWLFIVAVISGAGVLYFGRKKKTVR